MSPLRVALLCLALLLPLGAQAQEMPALQHGINLSSWLANAPRQPMTPRDFAQIAQAGFDHVRLPFNPEYVGFHLSEDGSPTAQIDFTGLDRALALAELAHMPVILDLHPGGDFVDTLERHSWAENGFIDLWKAIALRYKDRAPDTLVFELLNEPQYYKNEAAWNKLSARAVTAIRTISPQRIIVIGAPHGSDLNGLASLEPSNDPRLIYAFHFYEPYIITHQGIHQGFATKMIRFFRALPYPSDKVTQTASVYAPDAPDAAQARRELDDYTHAPWNAAHIAARIKIAQDWADLHHVRLLCGEFGVLRNHIDAESRYRWIHDARAAMDAGHIGWEVWDYSDLFGIAPPVPASAPDAVDGSVTLADPKGVRRFDPQALPALGLDAKVRP